MSTVTNEEEFKSFLKHIMSNVSLSNNMADLLECLKEATKETSDKQMRDYDRSFDMFGFLNNIQ